MKNIFISIITLSLLIITPIVSQEEHLPIPRYGSITFDQYKGLMTDDQKHMLENGTACYHVKYETALAFDNSVLNYRRMYNDGMGAVIVTPYKSRGHNQISPMLAFTSMYGARSIEICGRDGVDNYASNPLTHMGVNYMLVNGDFPGGYSAFNYIDSDYTINQLLNLDVRSEWTYAFVGSIQHDTTGNAQWATNVYSTFWMQSFDYDQKAAVVAWTDTSENRNKDNHPPVLITMVAVPVTTGENENLPEDINYQAGKVRYFWPRNETVEGGCIDVVFNKPFSLPPYMFTMMEFNMNTERIGLTSWVEDVNETGARICTSTLAYNYDGDKARILREDPAIYFHYIAFTDMYTDAQIADSRALAHSRMHMSHMSYIYENDESTEAMLHEIFNMAAAFELSTPFNIRKFTNEDGGVTVYFDDKDGHYFTEAMDHVNKFRFDETVVQHKIFMEKYGATKETEFHFEFIKDRIYGPYKADGQCSATECTEFGGSLYKNRYPKEDFNFNPTITSSSIRSRTQCNSGPCPYTEGQYAYFISETNEYSLEPIEVPVPANPEPANPEPANPEPANPEPADQPEAGNSGVIIGVIVAIVVVIAAGAFAYFYMKSKDKNNSKATATAKSVAFKQLV